MTDEEFLDAWNDKSIDRARFEGGFPSVGAKIGDSFVVASLAGHDSAPILNWCDFAKAKEWLVGAMKQFEEYKSEAVKASAEAVWDAWEWIETFCDIPDDDFICP